MQRVKPVDDNELEFNIDTPPSTSEDATKACVDLRIAGKHIVSGLPVCDLAVDRVSMVGLNDALANNVAAVYVNITHRP